LIRLSSALLLPVLSLPLTHSKHSQLRFGPHQHAFRLRLLGGPLTHLLFEFFAPMILAPTTTATISPEPHRSRDQAVASLPPGVGASLSVC
jgi:hypothetical protein